MKRYMKLDSYGVAHHFILALIVVGTAIGGTYYLIASHADTSKVVDLSAYGAIGDGKTDDTAALQKAFAQVAPNTTITAPTGKTYLHTSALKLTVDGTKLVGGATFLATNESSSALYIAANNVIVNGAILKTAHTTHRWSAPDQNGINIDHVSDATIENVTVDGSGAAGVFAYGATKYLIQDVTVENTLADAFHNTDGSSFGTIVRPIIKNSGDDGVAVVSYAADGVECHDITVVSPKFYGNTNGRAYSIVGGYNVTFSDIYADNSNAASVYIGSEGDPYNTYGVSNIKVLGGTINHANQGTPDHGAVLLLAGRHGISDDDILVENLNISNTRSTTSRQLGLINYGGTFSKVTIRHIAITGGGNVYGSNEPDGSVYNAVDWEKDNIKLADHIGFTPQLPETTSKPEAADPVTVPVPPASSKPAPTPTVPPASKPTPSPTPTPPTNSSNKPDLIVTGINWNLASPNSGNLVRFSATVRNQGSGATPNNVINGVGFLVDGQKVAWSANNTASIPAGGTITLTADGPSYGGSWPAIEGNHTVEAFIDDVNRIQESNENNNTLSKSLTVAPPAKPDVIVTSVSTDPGALQAGQHVRFTAVIKNIGQLPTPNYALIGVGFLVDGQKQNWAIAAPSIAPGASVTLISSNSDRQPGQNYWVAVKGQHTVTAYADDVNRFSETNENNNKLSIVKTVR